VVFLNLCALTRTASVAERRLGALGICSHFAKCRVKRELRILRKRAPGKCRIKTLQQHRMTPGLDRACKCAILGLSCNEVLVPVAYLRFVSPSAMWGKLSCARLKRCNRASSIESGSSVSSQRRGSWKEAGAGARGQQPVHPRPVRRIQSTYFRQSRFCRNSCDSAESCGSCRGKSLCHSSQPRKSADPFPFASAHFSVADLVAASRHAFHLLQ
jgi:hypothetical protein